MSEDPSQSGALAQAAAKIAELQQELTDAKSNIQDADTKVASANADRDAAKAQVAAAGQQISALQGAISQHQQQMNQMTAALDKAKSDYIEVSNKFDAQSDTALLLKGITRVYMAPDKSVHQSAQGALDRLVIIALMEAGMPEVAAINIARDSRKLKDALAASESTTTASDSPEASH